MASTSGFRTRSPERDRETDIARVARMMTFLNQIAADIEAEKAGLETRYRNEVTDAGFLLAAVENEEASTRSTARVEALTTSIMRCERRLDTLSRQADLMREMVRFLERFVEQDQPQQDAMEPARARA
jgi:hypothetical protein